MPEAKKISKSSLSLWLLYFLGLILAVSTALPAYIQSNFLGELVSLRTIGLFFAAANLLTAAAIIFFPGWIIRLNNYFVTKVTLVMYGVALLCLSLANRPLSGLLAIALFTVTANLIWINMDLAVESFSKNSKTGRIRTLYFTFLNLGWISAPLLSSYLIGWGQYQVVFLVAAFLVLPVFLIVMKQRRRLSKNIKYHRGKILPSLKKAWKNKNLRNVFGVAFLLSLFYSSVVVYVPLYLHGTLGMEWSVLGPIFSLMLIPFILIEIPAGILADKYWGEKEMMFIGLSIIIVSLALFFFINQPIAWLWAAILFFSRCGAALLEAMRETYFFKIVDAENVTDINLFRIANPLGYVIGPLLAALILSFFSLPYLFLYFAIIMLAGFIFIAALKDTK